MRPGLAGRLEPEGPVLYQQATLDGLIEPQISREEPAKPPKGEAQPPTFARHLELARANPGQWVIVCDIHKGPCVERKQKLNANRSRMAEWLNRHVPLERWQLRSHTVPGTWCDKKLFIKYLWTLTPEEDAQDRVERRARWETQWRRTKEKRAEEALAARLEIRAAEREQRRSSRTPKA